MELEHIKELECPICKNQVVQEEKKNQHCNGLWNETRIFACGYKLRFSPNFKKVETLGTCSNSLLEKTKRLKRNKAKKKLENYIEKLDADEEFKEALLNDIRYTWS